MAGLARLLLLALMVWNAPADAQTPVDVALVLVVDASGSIEDAEFRLQKEGIAAAVTNPEVLAAVQGGPFQRIALAYVEWGSPAGAETIVDWAILDGEAAAAAFAGAVLAAPRSRQTYNAIGDALVHAGALLARCPCEAARRVIDLSGDNRDNRSLIPAPIARDQAVAEGITINALAIVEDEMRGLSGRPWLIESYEQEVIGGPGAFVMPAQTRRAFMDALRRKMVLEIAGLEPAPHALRAAAR